MKTSKSEYRKHCIYGTIGMVGLFLMGSVVGFMVNGMGRGFSVMNENQCRTIYERMDNAIKYSNYDSYEKLSNMYTKNCAGYIFDGTKTETKPVENSLPETTCGQIERILVERLYDLDNPDSEAHVDNAKVYANLSERGCPENSEKYKELAKKELEIARALTDDNMENERETTEMVETYKRLQMQQEAERMIEKAKKLTNPAIDFIIQLEKIIEED